jgi:hypothetical protein
VSDSPDFHSFRVKAGTDRGVTEVFQLFQLLPSNDEGEIDRHTV